MLYTMREELKKEVRQLIPALQSLDPQLRNRLIILNSMRRCLTATSAFASDGPAPIALTR